MSLAFFGKRVLAAMQSYFSYMLHERRYSIESQEDLVGDDLIRSPGSWSELKTIGPEGLDLVMSAERIFRDLDFVDKVFSEAGEVIGSSI